MKLLWTLMIICCSTISCAQNEKDEYLVRYGQVWGFLKYFHPSPSKKNWDQILLEDYAKIKNCTNKDEFNVIIASLIDDCGGFKSKYRFTEDTCRFESSFEWIYADIISKNNTACLVDLLENKPKFKNKYISKNPLAGNPKITNEEIYGEYSVNPAINYLALTRYWNIINYYCPNRDIIPENWTETYRKYVHEFIEISNYEDYCSSVQKVTSEIRDGHGFLYTHIKPKSNYRYAPFYCSYTSEGYYVTLARHDSTQLNNLKKLDKIISIDGESVSEINTSLHSKISSSNDYYHSKRTCSFLRLTEKKTMEISVERNGEMITCLLPTMEKDTLLKSFKYVVTKRESRSFYIRNDSISGKEYLYINMGSLKRSDIDSKFKRTFKTADHIVLDCRSYPRNTFLKLSKLLMNERTTFAKFRQIDFDYPGYYKWTQSQTIRSSKSKFNGNVYVLVDYKTMSQGEYSVMALQQYKNTKVIGGQTAGADGNITEIPLPFGVQSVFSGLSVYYPDGTPTQQIGIERDYEIEQNKNYIAKQQDQISEKALQLIRESKIPSTE
jgi:C-terminal processing protease CtpA/Prc